MSRKSSGSNTNATSASAAGRRSCSPSSSNPLPYPGRALLTEQAGPVDLAFEPAAEHAFEPLGNSDQRVEVDAGLDSFALEQVDEVLGRDVACRARGVWAAAEAADRRVEHFGAGVERRERVRIAGVPGVVAMKPLRLRAADQIPDLARGGDADRVGEDDLGAVEPRCELAHPRRIDVALEGAAERDADRDRRRLGCGSEDPLDALDRLGERRVGVALVELLGRAEGRVHAVEPRGGETFVALLVQDEAGVLRAGAPLDFRDDLFGA